MGRQVPQQPDMPQSGNYNNIPVELRNLRQWVCYRMEIPADSKDNKPTKVPKNPNGGARARINDPNTWNTFQLALERSPRYDGIEFMLSADDPYTFIDLDHCIDEQGNIERWAQKIINNFDSYTEFSQSGHGIHILVRGSKPGAKCRNIKDYPNIEFYDHSRPIVMTGNLVPGTCGIIQPAANQINELYTQLFGVASQQELPQSAQSHSQTDSVEESAAGTISDSDLIALACKAKGSGLSFELLWNGNLAEYNGDWSAGDQALCNHLAFWTNRDASRMDSLFRQSGLMRDKWADRQDYREATIAKAIKDTPNGFQPKPKRRSRKTGKPEALVDLSYLDLPELQSDTDNANAAGNTPQAYLSSQTDLGNAEYMIARHGHNLRYHVESRQWLVWTGQMWEPNANGMIERIAVESIRSLYDLLDNIQDDHDGKRRQKLLSHIIRSESRPRIEAMIALARFLPGVPVQSHELDSDHWTLNCANGTIDLRTGKLHGHNKSDLITKCIPIEYDAKAKCPRWMQFLEEVFQGNQDIVGFVHRMAGYILTGDTREESVFILTGKGSNGKSKFVDTLAYILGDYTRDTPTSTFIEKRSNDNTADLAYLHGARLVTASESEDSKSFNEPLIKKLSGRDPITCRFLHCNFFTYRPTYKVLFSTNEIPKIKSQNNSMKRRIKIIPFKVRFYDPEDGRQPVKDDGLEFKLKAEASGILRWMVQGCIEWGQKGIGTPKCIRDEIEKLFESQDPLGEFIEDECVIESGSSVKVSALWDAYLQWCEQKGRMLAYKQVQWFSRAMAQRDDIEPYRSSDGRYLEGIRLDYRNPFATNGNTTKLGMPNDENDENRPFSGNSLDSFPSCSKLPENGQNTSFSSLESDFVLEEPWEDDGE